jgi:hypothetical protein
LLPLSTLRVSPCTTRPLRGGGRANLDQEWTYMASSGKKKTTMAKLSRESRLRERRQEKQARKELRKQAAAEQADHPEGLPTSEAEAEDSLEAEHPALEPVARASAEN